jgi:predicted glycosyltransferase
MKIWFDISNSPHVNLFYNLIKDLEEEGHSIIITSRPLANTIDLLNQKSLKHVVVGKHYGKNLYKKIFGYPVRVLQLVKFLKPLALDLAVSQSSFHSPLVAKVLSIPSIYTNDNEHALGNIPSYIFATKILIPENLAVRKAIGQGASSKKITQYPGIKEGIYLWSLAEQISLKRKLIQHQNLKIYVRPEPLTAQYYKGGLNFLDCALMDLQNKYSITILTRDKQQFNHYKQEKFASLNVPEKPLTFENVAADCRLFVGAGGSMTREMAILGIPTISVYQDSLLDVDVYLIDNGLMCYEPNITSEIIIRHITDSCKSGPHTELLTKGKLAYEMFKSQILNFRKS